MNKIIEQFFVHPLIVKDKTCSIFKVFDYNSENKKGKKI